MIIILIVAICALFLLGIIILLKCRNKPKVVQIKQEPENKKMNTSVIDKEFFAIDEFDKKQEEEESDANISNVFNIEGEDKEYAKKKNITLD